ncbi:DUF819 family protein [Gemelliphila palaticanis]|uniref:DUF819 domain-containing protein n=1 Tax=Gemelliphila palaticanis TaxID=81950 RepID=A0ABX2SZ90_9BACL|nr:DUF819 family protein [Gemella palaticanis]MBF0714748.1 DUF819 domain-containing protein [Gemella palaticanis]NYS46678.1 DUF819 domain-containing protein [Gemella palaticanis]
MISSENIWALTAILLTIVAISIYLEEKFSIAKKISGAVIALILAATLSNLNIIPYESVVYDNVWSYVVPLAIPMLLFSCDIKAIWKESSRLTIIFLISSVGTMLGAIIGYFALSNFIPSLNHIAGMMSASYIGGGVNFVAVASSFNIPSDLISAATVSDNLLMVLYFFVLITIPTTAFFKKHFKSSYQQESQNIVKKNNILKVETSVKDIAFTFAISSSIVAISFYLSKVISSIGESVLITLISNKYLILATLTIIITSTFSNFFKTIKSSNEIGTFLIYIFFAVIGVPASISSIIEKSPLLLLFCAIMVLTNMLVTFIAAKIFNFTLEEAIIASNANIGGPTTAAAMAISKNWNTFVAPAMIVGTLGYVIGTYFGILLGQYLM